MSKLCDENCQLLCFMSLFCSPSISSISSISTISTSHQFCWIPSLAWPPPHLFSLRLTKHRLEESAHTHTVWSAQITLMSSWLIDIDHLNSTHGPISGRSGLCSQCLCFCRRPITERKTINKSVLWRRVGALYRRQLCAIFSKLKYF